MDINNKPIRPDKEQWGEMGPYLSLLLRVGLVMVGSIGVFFFLGWSIGRFFSLTAPFVMGGVFMGVLLGFFYVYRELMRL